MKLPNLKITMCLVATAALVGCMSPGNTYTRSTGRALDDKATTSRVKSSLGKDSLVKATDINVTTFRGHVHLTGFVDHPVQKERASQITRNVDGVEWFKNDIIVITELPTSPETMSSGQQMREPSGAERNRGKQGSGSNWQQGSGGTSSAAEAGVEKSVKSTGQEGEVYESSGTSNDLSHRINTQLRSENAQAAENVRIETAPDGKVTLRGTVGSRDEKNRIEDQVKAISGVKKVDNELEVQK